MERSISKGLCWVGFAGTVRLSDSCYGLPCEIGSPDTLWQAVFQSLGRYDDSVATPAKTKERSRLRRGDVVEVRSEEEILRTLDPSGKLGALPFMPEMLRFCGKRFRVS